MGYSESCATKLASKRVSKINLERLEKFSLDFNSTSKAILPGHALHSLKKKEISDKMLGKIFNLPAEKIEQIHDILKNMD